MLGQVAQQRERLRAQGAFDIAVPQPALDPIEAKVTEGYETSSGHDRLVVGVASCLQAARRHPPGRRTVGSKDTARHGAAVRARHALPMRPLSSDGTRRHLAGTERRLALAALPDLDESLGRAEERIEIGDRQAALPQ